MMIDTPAAALLAVLLAATPAERLAEAGARLASGDETSSAEAEFERLANGEGEVAEDAALALGRLHLERGDESEALPYLRRVASGKGGLAGWGRLLEARALAVLDRKEEALGLLGPADQGSSPAGPDAREALLLRADLEWEARAREAAARDYGAFLTGVEDHPRRREAAWRLGVSLDEAGRRAEALAALWSIWWEDPGSPWAEDARSRAEEIAGSSEDLSLPVASGPDLLDHARRLRQAGRALDAAKELEALSSAGDRQLLRESLFERALDLYTSRRNRDCLALLDRLLKDPAEWRCRALALRARTLWYRTSEREAAGRAAAALTESCPWAEEDPDQGREEGLWIRALLLLDEGSAEQGEALLQEIASRPNRLREAASWKLGILLFGEARYEKAAGVLSALADLTPSDGYRAAALYWTARSRLETGAPEKARAPLLALVAEQPYSYYGMGAGRILEGRFHADPEPEGPPLPPGVAGGVPESVASRPGFSRAVRLERAGLTDLAGAEYMALREPGGDLQPALVLRVARAYSRTRWAYRGVRLMREAFGRWEERAVEGGDPEGFRAAFYPRPFLDAFRDEARARGLDPALALAIARQESLFDPEIRSWAGAVGLMQLMPATAAEEAKRLGIRRPREEDLADPEVNLRIGVFHLSRLMERFRSVPAAVAAYNAGAGRVSSWLKERPLTGEGAVSEDYWIDSIPVAQTRLYVKGVLRAFEEYRGLGAATGASAAF